MTEQLFKAFIQFLIEKIILKFPILGLAGINPVFSWIATKIAYFFYDELTVFVSYKIIDIHIYRNLVAYNESWQALKKETDKTKIIELKSQYDEKLKNLISFNSGFVRKS